MLEPNRSGQPRFIYSFVAGAVGGFASCIIASPTELIRIRMQMQGIGQREYFIEYKGHRSAPEAHKYYRSIWDCCKKIYKNEGPKGLCRGGLATILRDTQSFACYYPSMDYFRYLSSKFNNTPYGEDGPFTILIGGGFSGTICWLVSYPFDVVKSRLQGDGVERNEYKGMVDCIRKTYRSGGVAAFYRGITPTLVRAFPTNATTWLTYIMIQRLFNKQQLI